MSEQIKEAILVFSKSEKFTGKFLTDDWKELAKKTGATTAALKKEAKSMGLYTPEVKTKRAKKKIDPLKVEHLLFMNDADMENFFSYRKKIQSLQAELEEMNKIVIAKEKELSLETEKAREYLTKVNR